MSGKRSYREGKRHESVVGREYRRMYSRQGSQFGRYWVDEGAKVNVVLVKDHIDDVAIYLHDWSSRDGFARTKPYLRIRTMPDTKDNQVCYAITYNEDGESRFKLATTLKPILRVVSSLNKHGIVENLKPELIQMMEREARLQAGEADWWSSGVSEEDLDTMLEDAEIDAALDKLLNE